MSTRRFYSPAYREANGSVIADDTKTTVIASHAASAVAQLNEDADWPEYFVAYRDVPEWQELSPPECCGHSIRAHECGLCQIVTGDTDGNPLFCDCPLNS